MSVPNHDKVKFKDMTPEERSAIVEAWLVGNVEYFTSLGSKWLEKQDGGLYPNATYRIKPRQLVIPWEHIKPEYKWAAMDMDNVLILHKKKPIECGNGWSSASECVLDMLNINTTGIDWRDSLVQRPEGNEQ